MFPEDMICCPEIGILSARRNGVERAVDRMAEIVRCTLQELTRSRSASPEQAPTPL